MSGNDKNIPMYSSSDIERYLNGELSAPEMHALERAALDDPFLADALDGIKSHRHLPERPPFHEDVVQLQQRLQDRVAAGARPASVRPLFMRYAAAMILLVGLGLTAYYIFLDRGASKVSALQHHEPDTTPATPPPWNSRGSRAHAANATWVPTIPNWKSTPNPNMASCSRPQP